MPAKKVRVKNIDEVQRELKRIRRDSLNERVIVNAAKKAGDPVLKEMRQNLASINYSRVEELGRLLGKKKIPTKYGGKESPGSLIGLKSKNAYSIETSGHGTISKTGKKLNKAISIYWIEYGTAKRKQKSTGRGTGLIKEYAPLRRAIKSTVGDALGDFKNQLVDSLNKFIRKGKA